MISPEIEIERGIEKLGIEKVLLLELVLPNRVNRNAHQDSFNSKSRQNNKIRLLLELATLRALATDRQ